MTFVLDSSDDSSADVILVHGLWVGPWTLRILSRRLSRCGFKPHLFSYPATSASLETHAHKLYGFAREVQGDTLHFIGHSLGGLVILRMMAGTPDLPPGRIVLLGCPLGGSVVARRISRLKGVGKLLGKARTTLETGYARLPEDRETGLIAGSGGIGLGSLVGGTGGPGDGTVSLQEASATGLQERLVLPVSHTGLVYSATVARHVANFLKSGRFNP